MACCEDWGGAVTIEKTRSQKAKAKAPPASDG